MLTLLWAAIYLPAAATPTLLDDADATHAQAAQAMLSTHDFVILRVDGVPYLEKAPLPYWLAALSLRLFGPTAFAIHLPVALAVLGLALLGARWAHRAYGSQAALLTALFVLTSIGPFLFTRVFLPDALLSLLIALTLYLFLRALDPDCTSPRAHAYAAWAALACAVLTKGLFPLVVVALAGVVCLLIRRDATHLYRLRLPSGLLLFLAIAAPWHILAARRYPETPTHHGFLWFYFVNEHFLRYLGQRVPRDYNKLPAAAYWLLHLVWLFPWSLFAPTAIILWLLSRNARASALELDASGERLSRLDLLRAKSSPLQPPRTFADNSTLLLALTAAIILLFFAFSTNQEYYTFPAWLPLLMLLAAPLSTLTSTRAQSLTHTSLRLAFAAFAVLGLAAALALAYALWHSRTLPPTDLGTLLAHRGVGSYTLSTSHLFDLSIPAFAALRLPAALAALTFAIGPLIALTLFRTQRLQPALLTVALTTTTVFLAAHLALLRFAPVLSSCDFAQRIQQLESAHAIDANSQIMLFGDQAFGSSIPFYLHRHVSLVDGRSTSMLFGSTLPDAAPIFLTHDQLAATWATGPRKLLFVPPDQQPAVDTLHLTPRIPLLTESGKTLYTDRPLNPPTGAAR